MSALPHGLLTGAELVHLPGGETISVRPMQPTDAAALRQLWPRLSERTVYQRFMTTYPRGLPERTVRSLVAVDHEQREAIVAIAGNAIVGVGRYHTLSPGEAEIAVLVEDAWQRRGVGRALTERIARLAQRRGIVVLRGTMLAGNDAAYRLMQAVFGEVESRISSGEREFTVVLPPAAATA